MCRWSTRVCIHHLDFQHNNFLCVFFLVKIQPLYVNFSIPPCGKWFFPQCFIALVDMRFGDMYLTHLETRIWRGTFHIYFRKWFFWPSKLCCSFRAQGKKTFWSTLNVMILQTVRNECVRFGGHVDIEVTLFILFSVVYTK
jgi:hypothetical protein